MELRNVHEKSKEELIALLYSYAKRLDIKKRYHLILDRMVEGFQLLDSDFRYLYVNNTVINQSRYSEQELLGAKMTERYPGIENTEVFTVLRECLEKQLSKTYENEFVYPDGVKAWFRLSIQPVEEGLFILSMDITDAKKAEFEKEQHVRELEELLFKISHQVRQPVCHVMGVSHLLDNSLITLDELKVFVGAIKNSIELLDRYTRELTEFVSDMQINEENNRPYSLYPKKKS